VFEVVFDPEVVLNHVVDFTGVEHALLVLNDGSLDFTHHGDDHVEKHDYLLDDHEHRDDLNGLGKVAHLLVQGVISVVRDLSEVA